MTNLYQQRDVSELPLHTQMTEWAREVEPCRSFMEWDEEGEELFYKAIRELESNGKAIAALQAKIDDLMLEYCPDEMTAEQMANWAKHQVPSKEQP